MQFNELNLGTSLLRAIEEQGYTEPTPIQQQAIPHILEGRDLIGLAQTGTGKTAAFALPTLDRLYTLSPKQGKKSKRFVQVLVLAPTRELAMQIGKSFDVYGKFTRFRQVTVFGGVSQGPQVNRLNQGVNIVVATPGRLIDLINQKLIRLDQLEILIMDEADRMFDMGFLPDIRRIIQQLPTERQTLLFSATMPPDIQKLAEEILVDPVEVAVTPESTTVESIEQHVFFVEKNDKRKLLKHLFDEHNMHRTLVFTRTKHGADRLSQQLSKANISCDAIHGDKSQRARKVALDSFKSGKIQVLVATDIAARGIDVDDVSHVVNFDLPNETESYVHRIGRTGRAGATGIALSFCAMDEREYLVDIERLIQMHIPVMTDHPYMSAEGIPQPTDLTSRRGGSSSKARSNGRRNGGSRNGSGGNGSKNGSRRPRSNNSNRNGNGSSANGSQSGNRRRNQQRRKPTPQV